MSHYCYYIDDDCTAPELVKERDALRARCESAERAGGVLFEEHMNFVRAQTGEYMTDHGLEEWQRHCADYPREES